MAEEIKYDEINTEPEFDYQKTYDDCFVDLDVVIERPPTAISIGQYQYAGQNYDLPVHTYGEFSAIVAPSKTKKSFYKSALIAAYIGGKANKFFPNMKTHRDKDYFIVDLDTEQGAYYAQYAFRRIQSMTGKRYDNYLPFATRSKTPMERVMLVESLLEDERYKGKIKFITIDGVADLIENTNDIVMSNEIAQKILKWTDVYGVHLVTVIHKLIGVNKPTGHLGSYVLKKAETVVFLKNVDEEDKKSDVMVNHKYSRGREFNDFCFNVNSEGLPYQTDGKISNFDLS